MEIQRIYDKIIASHLAKYRQTAFFSGPRQVGKTTVAKHFAPRCSDWNRECERNERKQWAMKRVLLMMLVGIGLSLPAAGQEYGRGSLSPSTASPDSGMGRAELPPSTFGGGFLGGTLGLKLAVGWAKADWSVGPIDGSDTLFVPSGSLFYKATDNVDINLSALFLHAEDKVGDGKTKAEMTRLALGVRFWPMGDTRVTPYVGAGIGYYFLGGKMDHAYCTCNKQTVTGTLDVDNVPGAYLEGGVAWQITDNFFINTDLAYDLLLSSPTASIGAEEADFDIKALSVNLGITFMF